MASSTLTRRLFWAAEALLLAGAVGAAAWLSRAQEWHPLLLVGLLLALAVAGQLLHLEIRGQNLSAAFIAFVLAMSLLGPAPAVLLGIVAMVLISAPRRLPLALWLNNLSTHAVFPLAGGLTVRALIGDVHDPRNHHLVQSVTFALVVVAVFMVMNALNFALIALDVWVTEGRSLRGQVRDLFVPMQPGQIAMGALAAVLAVAYTNLGLSVLLGSIFVLLLFQYLMGALLRSESRADQLEARSVQLVSLQLGVLRTLVKALEMRDPSTSRHASAVARYAKALAKEIGCDKEEQEVVRTAALLHDIGKFTWPDRVLHAAAVNDQDQAIVKRHPQEGSILVGALDGYGPAADAILYHHERVDGLGYPAGLIGKEIPLASRILAICSAYDTMTAREGYRSPMTPPEALAELRIAVEHGQFDSELAESFIAMVTRNDPVSSTQDDPADFETELEFERRVQEMAQPTPPASSRPDRRPSLLASRANRVLKHRRRGAHRATRS
jgi:putative nucleotidyltransferase with HDIG domain